MPIFMHVCFVADNFLPMLGKGTRVVNGKLWKIRTILTIAFGTVMRLNYVGIDYS